MPRKGDAPEAYTSVRSNVRVKVLKRTDLWRMLDLSLPNVKDSIILHLLVFGLRPEDVRALRLNDIDLKTQRLCYVDRDKCRHTLNMKGLRLVSLLSMYIPTVTRGSKTLLSIGVNHIADVVKRYAKRADLALEYGKVRPMMLVHTGRLIQRAKQAEIEEISPLDKEKII